MVQSIQLSKLRRILSKPWLPHRYPLLLNKTRHSISQTVAGYVLSAKTTISMEELSAIGARRLKARVTSTASQSIY